LGKDTLHISLWDTAGAEEYDTIRYLCYPQTDLFIVCYSITDPDSLKHVEEKWCNPKAGSARTPTSFRHYCVAPYILVGLKKDMRNDLEIVEKLAKKGQKLVTEEEGRAVAKKVGALDFLEVSAITQESLKSLFDQAVKHVIMSSTFKEKKPQEVLPFPQGTLHVTIVKANGLRSADSNGLSDPWVEVGTYEENNNFHTIKHTKVITKALNPEFHEQLEVQLTPSNLKNTKGLRFIVWDKDFLSSDFLGQYDFLWSEADKIKNFDNTVDLHERKGKSEGVRGNLTLKMKFT